MEQHSYIFPDSSPDPGPPLPDHSPEARRRKAIRLQADLPDVSPPRISRFARSIRVLKRTALGAWNDGFIHAGNLAYMAMLAIFPFFILGAAIFTLLGEPEERAAMIIAVVTAFPPIVAKVIEPVARNVIDLRTGWLLWAGAIFGLWTVGSLIETIRDILRRAYGTGPTQSFWRYRLASSGIIIAAVVLLMVSLIAQVLIGAAQEIIEAWLPQLDDVLADLALSRLVPALGLFGSIYLLLLTLTPARYRDRRYPKWPGALLVTAWWLAVASLLPPLLRSVFAYDLTYGSLAGIMIALFFFWLVGIGVVVGAELNAALAVTPEERGMPIAPDENGQSAGNMKQGDISA